MIVKFLNPRRTYPKGLLDKSKIRLTFSFTSITILENSENKGKSIIQSTKKYKSRWSVYRRLFIIKGKIKL